MFSKEKGGKRLEWDDDGAILVKRSFIPMPGSFCARVMRGVDSI